MVKLVIDEFGGDCGGLRVWRGDRSRQFCRFVRCGELFFDQKKLQQKRKNPEDRRALSISSRLLAKREWRESYEWP